MTEELLKHGGRNKLSERWARTILGMIAFCWSEGQLSEDREILDYIAATYPDLKEEYSWLPWEKIGPTSSLTHSG